MNVAEVQYGHARPQEKNGGGRGGIDMEIAVGEGSKTEGDMASLNSKGGQMSPVVPPLQQMPMLLLISALHSLSLPPYHAHKKIYHILILLHSHRLTISTLH